MGNLKFSAIVKISESGNSEFSARKVRGQQFDGLMDPVIGFDHFQLTKDVFGAHPHAGMSAVSYLFEDSAPYHNLDSIGTDIVITPGSLMWTWSGRGVVHTEFPVPDGAKVHGLQLFVNIPAIKKQQRPQSIFVENNAIPEWDQEGIIVRVVTGNTGHLAHPVELPDAFTFLHIFLAQGKTFIHNMPATWNATIYTISGNAAFENESSDEYRDLDFQTVMCVGSSDHDEVLKFTAKTECQIVLLSGLPLREEIFSAGAMAMGSAEELRKAQADFTAGRLGFIEVDGQTRKVILPI